MSAPLPETFPQKRTKTCERCHKTFECGGPNCWCANVQLPPILLATLGQSHTDCLCQSCLQELKNGLAITSVQRT